MKRWKNKNTEAQKTKRLQEDETRIYSFLIKIEANPLETM